MGNVRCEYNWHNTGRQVFYDGSTFETLLTGYPVQFVEDFVGTSGGGPFGATTMWNVVDVGTATEAIVADSSNGQFLLHLSGDNQDQDAVLYHGNNRTFDVGHGLIFEARVNMAVLPGTGVIAVFGMCTDHNLDKDTIAESAWFRFDASLTCTVETDDTTGATETSKVATGFDASAGTWDIYRIDFTNLANVKFFINGARVAAATTFDMSALAGATLNMQPYFSLDKTGSAELGDINIDYVKIFSNRA